VSNNINSVLALIAAGCDLNLKDKSGNTALHLSAERGFHAVVEVLVSAGANTVLQNENHEVPLQIATNRNHASCIQALSGYSNKSITTTSTSVAPLSATNSK
jgi:ankyrin repeat protein